MISGVDIAKHALAPSVCKCACLARIGIVFPDHYCLLSPSHTPSFSYRLNIAPAITGVDEARLGCTIRALDCNPETRRIL